MTQKRLPSPNNQSAAELAQEGLVRGSDGNVYPMPDTGRVEYDPVVDFIGAVGAPVAAGVTGFAVGITGLIGGLFAGGKGLGVVATGKGAAGGGIVKGAAGGGAAVGGGNFITRFLGGKKGLLGRGFRNFLGGKKGQKKEEPKEEVQKQPRQRQQEREEGGEGVVATLATPVAISPLASAQVEDIQRTSLTSDPLVNVATQLETIFKQTSAIRSVTEVEYQNRKRIIKNREKSEEIAGKRRREHISEKKQKKFADQALKSVEAKVGSTLKDLALFSLIAAFPWEKMIEAYSNPMRVVKDSILFISNKIGSMIKGGKAGLRKHKGIFGKAKSLVKTLFKTIKGAATKLIQRIRNIGRGVVRGSRGAGQAGGRAVANGIRGTGGRLARPTGLPSASSAGAKAGSANSLLSASKGAVTPSASAVKNFGEKGATKIAKISGVFKKIPLIGSIIGIAIDTLILGTPLDQALVGAAGYALGFKLGTVAGAPIGQMLIPIPGLGAGIGALVGGILGGFLGDMLAKQLYRHLRSSMGLIDPITEAANEDFVAYGSSSGTDRDKPGTLFIGQDGRYYIALENGARRPATAEEISEFKETGRGNFPLTPEGSTPQKPVPYGTPKPGDFVMHGGKLMVFTGSGYRELTSEEKTLYDGGSTNIDGSTGPVGGGTSLSTTQYQPPGGIQKEMYDYLLSKGLSPNHAMGILANIRRESNFQVDVRSGDDGGPGGLFQWKGGRALRMEEAVPDWETNWRGQIDYALREPNEPGPAYISKNFSSPQEAADWWMKYWERPADLTHGSQVHAEYLNTIPSTIIEGAESETPEAPLTELEGLVPVGNFTTIGAGDLSLPGMTSGRGMRGGRHHAGIDIGTSGQRGWHVAFKLKGVVSEVSSYPGYGKTVILKCGNRDFLFAHLASFNVKRGDQYNGQIIGEIGNTGVGTGIHLHFEVRSVGGGSGTDEDPMPYVKYLQIGRKAAITSRSSTLAKLAPSSSSGETIEVASISPVPIDRSESISRYEEEDEDGDIVVPFPIQTATATIMDPSPTMSMRGGIISARGGNKSLSKRLLQLTMGDAMYG